MFGYPKWRAWAVIVISVFGLIFSIPNFLPKSVYEKVPKSVQEWWHPMTLGLDLQGGSSLLLEVQVNDLVNERLAGLMDATRTGLREKRIKFAGLAVEDGAMKVKILDSSDLYAAKTLIQDQEKNTYDVVMDGNELRVTYTDAALTALKAKAVEQSIEIVRRRIDELGTKEPSIQRQGSDRIVLQLPGVQNPAEVKALLGKTAKMTFHLVDEETTIQDAQRGKIPADSMLMTGDEYLVLKRAVVVGGGNLTDASVGYGERGEPVVKFSFDGSGAKAFAKATRENVNRRLAIVLDDEIISAPVINGPITGGEGVITGNFTLESAGNLAMMLRAGALPAPLEVIEERVVGAGLGTDSIHAGAMACVIGSVLVFIFMLAVYGRFGMFANLALVVNVLLLVALLSALNATLTLPGLAGIALTIGMAVDSNVLIYARMRDEAKLGRSPLQIINAGFENSFSAIFDAQITTLFAAIVLFFMGSGPIKGFSVTLGIGVVTSLFTAVMITKFLIMIWYTIRKPKSIQI